MQFNWINKFGLAIALVLLLVISSFAVSFPAAAILRQHQENSGVMRYHAQTSVKDKQGMTWQVVLFCKYPCNLVKTYHLRLVGFPGIATFIHPQPLEIISSKGQVFEATDIFANSSPADNVGEFDISEILPVLPQKGSLKLSIPLQGDRSLSLNIPESVIDEWQLLVNEV